MPILTISFGKDQESAVDAVLQELAAEIDNIEKSHDVEKGHRSRAGNTAEAMVYYRIYFRRIYGVYLFGHKQKSYERK
jgi:hypothetical protein